MSLTIILRKVGGVLTACFRRGTQRVRAAAVSMDVSRPGWSVLAVVLVLVVALLMARRGLRDFALAMMHGMMLSGAPPAPPAPSHFGEDGATTPIYAMATYPPGMYVSATDTTWFAYEGYEGTDRVILVTTYNHTTDTWSSVVPVAAHGQSDDSHGTPALVRDADGYVHCYLGAHDSDLLEYVTEDPDDPSSWWHRHTFSATVGYSYPHPVLVGSALYLFVREKVNAVSTRRLVVFHTTALTAGVPTWGAQTVLVSLGTDSRVYATAFLPVGTDVHFTFCLANDADTVRRHGYYAVYDTVAADLHNVDDSFTVATGSLPLGITDANTNFRFLVQTTDQSNLPAFAFDTNGDPHVVIMAGVGATGGDPDGVYDLVHFTHDGVSWSSPVTVASALTMYRSAEIALVTLPSAEMGLYYEDDSGDAYVQGGTMKLIVRSSGGSWGAASTVLAPDTLPLARASAVFNAHADARAYFTEVTATDDDSETGAGELKLYAHGASGFVTRPTITREPYNVNRLATGRVFTFQVPTEPVGARLKITGVGFQPAACRLWSSGHNAVAAVGASARACEGAAVSVSDQFAVATLMEDGADPMDEHTNHRTDCCYMVLTAAGASLGRIRLLSMDADGMTFEIVELFTGDRLVTVMAYDSAVVTDATTFVIQEAGATGNQGYTGFGFEPDIAFFVGVPDTTAAPNVAANSTWSVGVASAAASQWVMAGGGQDNVATANTMRYARGDECVAFYNAGVTALDGRAALVSFDADGLTLNWIARASTRRVYGLAMAGGSWAVGDTLSSTTLNALITVSGLGFTPTAVECMADRTGEDTAGSAEAQTYFWIHGAGSSASNRFSHTVGSSDAAGAAETMRAYTNAGVIYGVTANTIVQDSLIDLDSLSSGQFVLKQDDPAASQYFVGYVASAA